MDSSIVFVFLTIATIGAISFSNGNVDVLCRKSEKQALLRFKQGLKDPKNWLSTWDEEGDCCSSWIGVICNNLTGLVLELHVNSLFIIYPADYFEKQKYGLGDKINPSLLNLKYLKHLDLSGNNFEGDQIPSFISSFKSLMHLNLSYSGFGGRIPHQLGNLSSLQYLNLGNAHYNDLTVENLQWMSGLSSLEYVDMTGTNLSKAFDWFRVINTLQSLVELRLSMCELPNNFAPLSVVNSTSLVTLDLSWNNLGRLMPIWIFSHINLHSLNVGINSFGGTVPISLKNLTRLRTLDMGGNSFNSSIPQWMFCLNGLEYLDLSKNGLTGNIPSAIGNLTSINIVQLSSNRLEGKIPNSFGNFCKIKELDLGANKFRAVSGILKSLSMCAADSLELLNLHENQLSSQLSAYLERLTSLQHFDVSHNQLTGSFSEYLGQLVKLESVDLSHNLLNSVVSEVHFTNLTRLKDFYASGNSESENKFALATPCST